MSSGPMQGTASEPRQIRKKAAAGRWYLCRSVPELFRKGFLFLKSAFFMDSICHCRAWSDNLL